MSVFYIHRFTLSIALGEKDEDRWSGAKRNNIARLYREGSRGEDEPEDGEQTAKKEELVRVVSKLFSNMVKELKEKYKEGSALKGQKK